MGKPDSPVRHRATPYRPALPMAAFVLLGMAISAQAAPELGPTDPRFWLTLVKDVGFPILVAGYLLWEVRPLLQQQAQTLARIETWMRALHDQGESSRDDD